MSNSESVQTLSARTLLAHSPELVRGLPRKIRGLYCVAKQQKNPENSLASCIELAAKKYGDRPALVCEGQRLSYSELNNEANKLAQYLASTGTNKGDVHVVALENRAELLITVLALSKLGAVSALINTSQRGEVLRHSVTLVQATRVIVGQELSAAFAQIEDALPSGDGALLWVRDETLPSPAKTQFKRDWIELWSQIASVQKVSNPRVSPQLRANDPLCYFYTSGTTGLPKAAILTNGRFMKAYGGIGQACIQLKPSDKVYVPLPFYHATAMVVAWSSVISGGAALVMARKFSASNYWKDVVDNDVTALCYIGELCRYLVARAPSDIERKHHVRLMFGNGLRPEIWQEFKSRFGIARVHEFYGSSEGNVGFMNALNLDNTVGLSPVPYAIVEYDIDAEEAIRYSDGFMRKVQKGSAGLLLGEINDKSPFDGYTESTKTEKTILRNVFKQGDAWFNTGDLMRDLGFRHAQFVDRLGDTFRWKGENVSTTEVENILSQFDGVLDAIVYGVEIPNTNGRAGMAALRLKDGAALDLEGVSEQLRAQLPDYAVPHFLRLVDEVETTGTHKYKKAPLKEAAYHLDACGEGVYVRLPKAAVFEKLSPETYQQIQNSELSF